MESDHIRFGVAQQRRAIIEVHQYRYQSGCRTVAQASAASPLQHRPKLGLADTVARRHQHAQPERPPAQYQPDQNRGATLRLMKLRAKIS
jgi:hypothetical protein